MHLLTTDDFYSRLHDAGWSVGDVAFNLDGQTGPQSLYTAM